MLPLPLKHKSACLAKQQLNDELISLTNEGTKNEAALSRTINSHLNAETTNSCLPTEATAQAKQTRIYFTLNYCDTFSSHLLKAI